MFTINVTKAVTRGGLGLAIQVLVNPSKAHLLGDYVHVEGTLVDGLTLTPVRGPNQGTSALPPAYGVYKVNVPTSTNGSAKFSLAARFAGVSLKHPTRGTIVRAVPQTPDAVGAVPLLLEKFDPNSAPEQQAKERKKPCPTAASPLAELRAALDALNAIVDLGHATLTVDDQGHVRALL